MQPFSLTLKGFRGIRDGLGRDVLTLDFERLADGAELVAIGQSLEIQGQDIASKAIANAAKALESE